MSEFLPGELVMIVPLTDKPRYHPLGDQLGVVIEEQRGTGLYRVLLMGEENFKKWLDEHEKNQKPLLQVLIPSFEEGKQ